MIANNYIAADVVVKITKTGDQTMTVKEIDLKEINSLAQQMLKVHFGLEIETFSDTDIVNLKSLIQTYLRTK